MKLEVTHDLGQLRGLAATLLSTGMLASNSAAHETLYAVGGGFHSAIYTIDPVTAAQTKLFDLPNVVIGASDLAYDASSGLFFSIGVSLTTPGGDHLFSIDRLTGAVTMYPAMPANLNFSSGGLAVHPTTGVLYASGLNGFQSSGIFTIDKSTGVPTLIGQAGGQCCSAPFGFNINGLGFRSDGTLFANGIVLSFIQPDGSQSQLLTVDLLTGAATEVGCHGINVGRQLGYSGIGFDANDTLYALGSVTSAVGGLYTIDAATAAVTLVGVSTAPFGVDGGVVFVPDLAPTVYCTAKINSLGCVPAISSSGTPSVTSTAPFNVGASNVLNHRSGLLFYGYFRSALPFQGGWKCVASPNVRTVLQDSGGSALPANDCTGSYAVDFNAWIQGGVDPLLDVSTLVHAQFWSRDPAAPSTTGLTDAISFQIAP